MHHLIDVSFLSSLAVYVHRVVEPLFESEKLASLWMYLEFILENNPIDSFFNNKVRVYANICTLAVMHFRVS